MLVAAIGVIVAALQTLYTLIVFEADAKGTSFCPEPPPATLGVATAGACLAAAALIVFALMPQPRRALVAGAVQLAFLGAWFALGGWHDAGCAIELG